MTRSRLPKLQDFYSNINVDNLTGNKTFRNALNNIVENEKKFQKILSLLEHLRVTVKMSRYKIHIKKIPELVSKTTDLSIPSLSYPV